MILSFLKNNIEKKNRGENLRIHNRLENKPKKRYNIYDFLTNALVRRAKIMFKKQEDFVKKYMKEV